MSEEIEVKIKKKEINLIVWIIPIISLIVGGWLVYKYYSNLGPLITIKFKNSGGLEPKRSFVKFRDVKVGKVESVEILKGNEGVLVKVRMQKDIEPFLNDTTKFWIVKPEIGIDKIRGLDALLSGPYIQMYAKPKKFTKDKFIGLQEPPLDSAILNGKVYKLISNSSYGLSERLPVYYKQLKVGMIRKINLKNNKVYIYIVIWKKYDKYINNSTKFWNLKTVNVSLKKNYLNLSFPTFQELVFGGIEFETPFKTLKTKKEFKLYSSKVEAFENRLGGKEEYVNSIIYFDYDNSFLKAGIPVKFRGFDIGYVKFANSFYDYKHNKIITQVVAKINKNAFGVSLKELIQKGLSAYIKVTSIINSAEVDLEFYKKHKFKLIDGKIFIPSFKKKEVSLLIKLNKFIDKLNSLKLNETIDNINSFLNTTKPALSKALYSVANMSDSIKKTVEMTSKNLNNTLVNINNLTNSLEKIAKTYNSDSIFYQKVSKTLYDLDKTILNLNKVINKIDKKPNSIIFGD